MDTGNPAPGSLELVRRVVDTLDIYNARDAWIDKGSAAAWLVREGVLDDGDRITTAELAELRRMRETLRALAAANTTGEPPPAAAVESFAELAAPYPASVRVGIRSGTLVATLEPEGRGGARVMAMVAAALHEAVHTGTWSRLKSCANAECCWLFYDTSRSRTARWCSMGGCGSIAKSRRYRRRRRDAAATPARPG